jgi:fatty acid desaturase
MSSASELAGIRAPAVELPTLALIMLIHGAMLALTWFHASLPLWLWLALAAWFSAWWGSAQHEMLHGHPTRSRAFNTALATPPYWLWLPFERYRQTHLAHHNDDRLTDPLDDPESRYVTPEAWAKRGALMRTVIASQGTLLGRLTLGPVLAPAQFLVAEARALWAGDRRLAGIWGWHVVWTGLWLTWVIGVCRMPLWHYLLGVTYAGIALALVRSFCEHRAHIDVTRRTAIVEQSRVFGLLFLHNNLHAAHHRWPTVPWYRLPALYRERRAELIAGNGGLIYRGYGDIFRRYFMRPHHTPIHPMGRVPTDRGSSGNNGLRDRASDQNSGTDTVSRDHAGNR